MSKKFDKAAFLSLSRKEMAAAIDHERIHHERAEDDLKNVTGEGQWSKEIKATREADGRPCLTINRLVQFLRQVTGDLRQVNPAINISGADSNASPEMVEIYEGIIRQIQNASDASSVYEAAAESAAACSMGFFRVLTEYEAEDSFNQEIRIKRIYNPFSVLFDPAAREATRSDAQWVFVTDKMEKDAFEAEYPGKSGISVPEPSIDDSEHWSSAGQVVVAEKFWLEREPVTLYQLADGRSVTELPPGAAYINKRKSEKTTVMWAKISGNDVLEGPNEFASKYIPIVAVMGEEIHVGDDVYRSSVVRHAKEPQRLYNYLSSAEAEIVALQPKAPFMVTPKQIAGLEDYWAAANTANRPYLVYNPDREAPGMPQRISPPVSSQGLSNGILKASEDMKATTGIYDAALGQRSSETSGVAIRQRQMESDVSTSIYSDNMGKAVERCGRILLDMIPRVYDTTRAMKIIGKDNSERIVEVNKPVLIEGQPLIMNALNVGKYDINVSVGPNYTTKRQEASDKMMELVRVDPSLSQKAGDLLVRQMDFPGADQLADRLEKTLPPELRPKDEKAEGPDPMQQQAAAQMQAQQAAMQMSMQMEQQKLRQETAKAAQAEADAMKAEAEARKAGFELMATQQAAQSGLPIPGAYA